MDVNKIAGACLIIFGIINVLHEIVVRSTGKKHTRFRLRFRDRAAVHLRGLAVSAPNNSKQELREK
jgi:hypothetical protein